MQLIPSGTGKDNAEDVSVLLTQVQRVALHSLPVTPNGLKQFASSERGHTRIFGFWLRALPLWGAVNRRRGRCGIGSRLVIFQALLDVIAEAVK